MPQTDNHIPTKPESLKSTFPELEVRSEEVQEIIGRPPHWLVRWGAFPSTLFATVFFWLKCFLPTGCSQATGKTSRREMEWTGEAEIIKQDMRLLERVYNNITKELW